MNFTTEAARRAIIEIMSTPEFEQLHGMPASLYYSSPRHGGISTQGRNFLPKPAVTAKEVTSMLHTPDHRRRTRLSQKEYLDQGIGERVLTRTLTTPVYQRRIVNVEENTSGWFGVRKKAVRQQVVKELVGHKPIALGQISANHPGDMRPASVLGYSALTRVFGGYDEMMASHRDQAGKGRPGNLLDVGVIMPSREAAALVEQLQHRPEQIREFAAFLVREVMGVEPREFALPKYETWRPETRFVQFVEDMDTPPDGGIKIARY